MDKAYTTKIGNFNYPEVFTETATIRGAARLWGLPIEARLFDTPVSWITADGKACRGTWGEVPVGATLKSKSVLLADITSDIRQLSEYIKMGRQITTAPEIWATYILSRYGGGRGYQYCYNIDENWKEETSPGGKVVGIDRQSLAKKFLNDATHVAAEILKEAFAERCGFNEATPKEETFYVVFDWPQNTFDTYMLLSLLRPDAVNSANKTYGSMAICKFSKEALIALGVQPETAQSDGTFTSNRVAEKSTLVASSIFPAPKVENLAAFEETFWTLIKDRWDIKEAYAAAQIV